MTDTKPDLTPNERKVLDSLLALGEATAAKVGEHAGLAYPTTTPKLRKLETLGLAERFRNEDSQTLWRAASTDAAVGNDDSTAEAAPATGEPGHPGKSDTADADADGAAPSEPGATAPDTGETVARTPATPTAAPAALQPAKPEAAKPEIVEPEADEPAQPRNDDAPEGTRSTAAGPATTGDDAPAGADATAPADAPRPKAKRKRPAGALEASVLTILREDPDGQYKVNDLRKLVDKADEASGYPAASAGAIANALDKLTGKGQVVSIPAKHATFQAAAG